MDENDPSRQREHFRNDAVEVHWDSGYKRLALPEDLVLVSRPPEPVAFITHEVRRIAGILIAGDIVEDPAGNRGSIISESIAHGEMFIDWGNESGIISGAFIPQLKLIERPSAQPGETTPDHELRYAFPHQWQTADVADDDVTMWIHYYKKLEERLHRIDLREGEDAVEIELFLADVGVIDPRWIESLRYGGRPMGVAECTRFTLDKPLGTRTCIEVLREPGH